MTKHYSACVFILCLAISSFSHSLTLNGIGSYQQLRKEFYIAALYLTEPSSDPQAIINAYGSKRMVLKVTAKRWTPRRWSLQWQNDIAINNSPASDDELTNQIIFFTGFLQDNLTEGDEIIVEYRPTQGTFISINNVSILNTPTSDMFNYLVNVWIGKLPPSGEFKNAILSANPEDQDSKQLLSKFNSLQYSDSRSQLIKSWIKNTADAKRQALAKEQAKALAEKQSKEKAALALEQQNKKQIAAKPAPAPVKPKPVKKAKPVVVKKIASIKPDTKTKKSKAQLIAEDRYYQALYQWELNREIRPVIEYPEWAKRFGQKGAITINFTVNRKAEIIKLSDGNLDDAPLLVAEVQNAIKEVVPFILPPDALNGKQWNMKFSYVFDPNDSNQPYLSKPELPDSLKGENTVSKGDRAKTLKRYQDEVKDIITDLIEYPVWAKKLNQKGKVAVEITINREGNVDKTDMVVSSRHDALNQEVLNAIESAQPLPALPEELNSSSTKVTIQYTFE